MQRDQVWLRSFLKLGQRAHGIVVKVEAARLDHLRKNIQRQPIADDGADQRGGDRPGFPRALKLKTRRQWP